MSDILYDRPTMETLYDTLEAEGSNLGKEIDTLDHTIKKAAMAMNSQNAQDGLLTAYASVKTELTDTLDILNRLAGAVEDALHRALDTDKKIGDGFAAYA